MAMLLDLRPKPAVMYGVSATVGGGLGIVISLVVNLALIEISISPFFSLYFGVIFVLVGCLILWRILSHEAGEQLQMKKLHLSVFAGAIIFSGALCFLLDRKIFSGLAPWMKVPLYMVLGLAVAFALTFSIVDVLNYILGFFQQTIAKPIVESSQQVYLVLVVSLAMGVVFGFTFGLLDIEDEQGFHIRIALMREEHYCYPVGAVLGAFAGFGNEFFRQKGDYVAYHGIAQTEFDEDI
eukprot:NODE_18409_length_894_cov_7.049544.p1 GENE.NODE_18409_length_894_cov_7.049544~~NODE_18409_length_894_cov_7.049544.p1  ORF type:complete len:238 (+),score=74.79 NODE_18409_length_894_cov_7.049544:94-807(+)